MMAMDLLSRDPAVTIQALQGMYSTNTLTDITLLSQDDEPIYAHSCVLSSASTTIQVLLCSLADTLWGRKLKFMNVKYDVLKHYVDSLYIEDQKTNHELAYHLLNLCSFLKDSFVLDRMPAYDTRGHTDAKPVSIQVFGNDDSVMSEIVDIDVMEESESYCDITVEGNNPGNDLDLSEIVKEVDGKNIDTELESMIANIKTEEEMIESDELRKICEPESLPAQHHKMGDVQDDDAQPEDTEDEDVQAEDVQQDSVKQENAGVKGGGNNDFDWMCKTCNRRVCKHRHVKIKESDLHHLIKTEGFVIEEPPEIPPLDFSNLRPGQKLCAEKYKHVLSLPYQLLCHREWNMKKMIYRCPYCDCYIFSFSQIIMHYLHHEVPLPLIKCCLCDMTFRRVSVIRGHDIRIHKECHRLGEKNGTKECNLCGVRYCTDKALQRHMDNHDNDLQEIKNILEAKHRIIKWYQPETNWFRKSYKCEYCDRIFHEHPKLESHYLSAHGMKRPPVLRPKKEEPKSYVCPQCGIQYKKRSALRCHVDSVHATSRSHRCEVCSKTYKTYTVLQNHIDRLHGEYTLPDGQVSEYQCSECGRFLPSPLLYKAHMRYHKSKGWPLQCRVCDQRFKYHSCRLKHELQEHGRTAVSNRRNVIKGPY